MPLDQKGMLLLLLLLLQWLPLSQKGLHKAHPKPAA
jgi:hypothetical protein